MNRFIKYFERYIIIALMFLMAIIVAISTEEPGVILDYKETDPITMIAIALLIGTMTSGYYFLKKAKNKD